ncbi:Vitellogenin-1 [Gryllus bimaculatus]|nr:Vitellogenin-1 [Gryllus bimaculatus]
MEQSSFGQPQGLIESHLGIKLIRLKESHKPAALLGTLRHVDLVYHEEDPFLPENFRISKRETSGTPDHEGSKAEDINDDIHYVHKRGKALVELEDVAAQNAENKNKSVTSSKFHPLFNSSRPTGPVILPLVHSLQLIDQLSSNDSSFAFPLELPPNIPIRPFFRGNSTIKLSDTERNAFARNLVQKISSALQDPNQMPDVHTLSSFSILVEILRTFSYNQLKNLTTNYEAARSSQNAVSEEDEYKW